MSVRADFTAHVGDFDLAVGIEADNELIVLYGRSGSGKSLTLRALAGLLRPRTGRIEIGGDRTTLGTRFWIRDNGRGIAKEDEEKILAPFRRAGKQDVAGEGMGLSYVRTMVRQHGGQIWFESEPGVGTTFYFTVAEP